MEGGGDHQVTIINAYRPCKQSRETGIFTSTQGTPFTINPLQALLNNDSLTPFGQQILDGDTNLQNLNLSEIEKAFFYELKQHPTITVSPLNNIISIVNMTSGFKKWREDTSTSPSMRHLGHYKCLLKPDGQKLKEKLKDFNTTMLAIHNIIINSATSTGIPLKRWTLSEVIMIQKELNNPRINRLRVLNKYEADLNLVFKFFWPRLTTNHLESRNLLGKNQWGTRPHRSAENVSLIDKIINEIHCITCKPLLKLQDNTTVYYDRMSCNLSTLCSRSFGVPNSVCKLQVN